jgi:hypothetical protein
MSGRFLYPRVCICGDPQSEGALLKNPATVAGGGGQFQRWQFLKSTNKESPC